MSETSQVAQELPSRVRYRFGTFELDAWTGELRRNGVKVRLQDQPFLVLRKLLASAGTLVTREELHKALWPADTFVDFDTSLNTAIKRLREVLGDSADVPVFIETVPRRGYRFLAPVQMVQNGELTVFPAHVPPAPSAEESARRVRIKQGLLSFVGFVVAAVFGGAVVALHTPGPVAHVGDSTQITFDGIPKVQVHARGTNVYFNERLEGRVALMRVPFTGGPPVVLDSSSPGLYLGDVSQDGSKLVVGTPMDAMKGPFRLKMMDMGTGALQNVDGIVGNDVTWTPQGKLAVAVGRDIILADPDGSHQQKLLTAPGYVAFIRYSPDGRRLRFTVGGRLMTDFTIWEAAVDGSNLHEVLTEMTDYPVRCCGDWTPDGRYFLFETTLRGGSKIWAQRERRFFWDTASSQPVQLTSVPPNFFMGVPAMDGKKLVVTAAQPRAELVRYDVHLRQFVPFLSGISAGDVAFSRDGDQLVYVRYPEETLWRAKADGTEAAQLTGPSLRVALPHWSSDGTHIAFSGSRPGRPWNLYSVSSSGGPAEQLSTGALYDLDPSWSPDGTKLAFGQTRMEGDKHVCSIQLLDVASRRVTALPDTDGICYPRWSPDGKYLLAMHANNVGLLLYDFATQKWTEIAKDLGRIGYMEWAKDSKSVMFDALTVSDPGFYRLRLPDLRLETVVRTQDIRRYYGEFGPWTGMAPDGSPLLVRDISSEEVYLLDLHLP
jgi:Tol biopolymer transport system component/DNA-binding winged helix-turn-helix (wHTH) protein